MIEKTKKHKKGSISEKDISTLLQRYEATTMLTLLQEVAQIQDVKIDWNALVKKTATGISNVREYQMLWRHLAYRDTLVERLDDGAEPLMRKKIPTNKKKSNIEMDDDSDLDYELEALPPVGSEASTESAACVKVLIASGLQSDISLSNGLTVEAPLTINVPNGQSSRGPLENSLLQGTNITIPVSVQKQPLPMVMSEVLDANGSASGNLLPRRKRKPWSAVEDLELIAAVQKCGEGNWANILKGDFKHDRTALQLSQLVSLLEMPLPKVDHYQETTEQRSCGRWLTTFGGSAGSSQGCFPGPQHANGRQLDGSLFKRYWPVTNLNTAPSNSTCPAAVEASVVGTQSQHLSRRYSIPTTSKSRLLQSLLGPASPPQPMLQAKNVVHIIPGGGSLIKSPSVASTNPLPPNVYVIRTGLVATLTATYPTFSTNASRSLVASELKAFDTLNSLSCNPPKEHVKEGQVGVSFNAAREQVQEARAIVSSNAPKEQVQEHQTALPSSKTILKGQNDLVENLKCSSNLKITKDCQMDIISEDPIGGSEKGDDDMMIAMLVEEGRENQSVVEKFFEN
ncbi:unnamed protein product [Camellia sinensis]